MERPVLRGMSAEEELRLIESVRNWTIMIDDAIKVLNDSKKEDADYRDRYPERIARRNETLDSIREALRRMVQVRHEDAVALGIGDRYPPELVDLN